MTSTAITAEELDRLVGGAHHNPHGVLGTHEVPVEEAPPAKKAPAKKSAAAKDGIPPGTWRPTTRAFRDV